MIFDSLLFFRNVIIYDLENNCQIICFKNTENENDFISHNEAVYCVECSMKNDLLISGSKDGFNLKFNIFFF